MYLGIALSYWFNNGTVYTFVVFLKYVLNITLNYVNFLNCFFKT